MGGRRRWLTWLAAGALLSACASDAAVAPAGNTTTPGTIAPATIAATTAVPASSLPATSTGAPSDGEPVVQATIDIGGGQVLGLAADATSVWAITFDGAKLVRIDPTTNAVTDSVDIEGAASVLTHDSDVWVGTFGGSPSIHRIDAATATEVGGVSAGEVCCDLSFGNGLLWAVDPGGAVKGIDPATNSVVKSFTVDLDRNAHTNVVFGGESLWVSSDTTMLHRVDPMSGDVEDIDVGGGVPFVDRDGLVWGASPTQLWAVDDATGAVVQRVDLQRSIEVLSLDVGTATLWVGIRHPGRIGAVQQIEISTGEVLGEFKIPIPARIVFAFDSVWVTDSGSTSVYRIGTYTER
jgi:hypothetical protein